MEVMDSCPYKVSTGSVVRVSEATVGQNQHQELVLVLVLWSVQVVARQPTEENLTLCFYLWTLLVQVHKRKQQADKSSAVLAS